MDAKRTSRPLSPTVGQVYFDSSTNKSYSYIDGAWVEVDISGTPGEPGAPGQPGRDGADGADGADGVDGVGLDYSWQGTKLGVKRENETQYAYVDLEGPKGDTGPPGMAVTYTHNQISPASTWTITHDTGKYPAVAIVDSGGNVVIGEIQYMSENQLKVTFTAAFAGKAYLN